MEEVEDVEGCLKSEEDKERKKLMLEKLSEIESRIKQACVEENYDLAGWDYASIQCTVHTTLVQLIW